MMQRQDDMNEGQLSTQEIDDLVFRVLSRNQGREQRENPDWWNRIGLCLTCFVLGGALGWIAPSATHTGQEDFGIYRCGAAVPVEHQQAIATPLYPG
jgi:hypothetical protein